MAVRGSTEPENSGAGLLVLRDETGGAARAAFAVLVGNGNYQCRLCSALLSVGDYLHLAVCDVVDGPLLDRLRIVLYKRKWIVRGLYGKITTLGMR